MADACWTTTLRWTGAARETGVVQLGLRLAGELRAGGQGR